MFKLRYKFILLTALLVLGTWALCTYSFFDYSSKEKREILQEQSLKLALSIASTFQSEDIKSIDGLKSFDELFMGYHGLEGSIFDLNEKKIIHSTGRLLNESLISLFLENQENTSGSLSRVINLDDTSYLMTSSQMLSDPSKIVFIIAREDNVSALVKSAIKEMAIPMLVILLLALAAAFLFSRQLVLPIERLTEATKEFAKGNWELKYQGVPGDEIGTLVREFQGLGDALKTREIKLAKANQELALAEKLASLGEFSAGIAHEIKNPLNAILAQIQLMKRKVVKLGQEEDHGGRIETITSEVYRANTIISDILSYSRKDGLSLSELATTDIISQVETLNRPICEDKNIELKISADIQGKIDGDRDKLIQVLGNLIENSSHALVDAAVPNPVVQLGTRLSEDEGYIELFVQDNGPGVPADVVSKIFDPFFTTKKAGEGTGLGLSLCYSMISQHNGSLSYDGDDNGALFIVRLPVKAVT